MKRILQILGIYLPAAIILCAGIKTAAALDVSIANLVNNPDDFIDQEVTVTGHLVVDGELFGPHILWLTDNQGNQVSTTNWTLYSYVLPPNISTAGLPRTMGAFVDRDVSVAGVFRTNTAQFPNMTEKYFIEATQGTILPSN